MLRRSRLRAVVLAILQLLPARHRPAMQRWLLRARQRLAPMTRHQINLIRDSGLWDENWFSRHHPQLATDGDSLRTFVRQGAAQALQPHPLFDSRWYLDNNPDVAAIGVNPLFHYLTSGHREGRQPNPLFSDHWYRDRNPDIAAFEASALQHYARFGDAEGRDPHPLIKTTWYREQHRDLSPHATVLAHYLALGEHNDLQPNAWFDPAHYRKQLSGYDGPSLLQHFVAVGADAGLDPCAEFSLHEYCENHPEVADRGLNPLIDFLDSGRARQRSGAAQPLSAEQWWQLFGRLTAQEQRRLRAVQTSPERPRVALVHAAGQAPQVIRSQAGESALDLQLCSYAEAVNLAEVDALLWLEQADCVYEDALALGLCWLQRDPAASVYFDERISADGEHAETLDFKPDWSPARARSGALHVAALLMRPHNPLARQLMQQQPSTLRDCLEQAKPAHLPFIGLQRKPKPRTAAPRTPRTQQPQVSIIIPTRDQLEYLRTCIEGIRSQTQYPAWDIVLIDNGSQDPEALAYLAELGEDRRITVKRWDRPFNYSELCNVGARLAQGELLCMLNNDIEISQPDWLDRLVDEACEPDCGAVGAMLLYPDGRIQSAGVLMGPGGVAANRFATVAPQRVPAEALDHVHEVSAVAGACLLTRKDIYLQLGGLDEHNLRVAFNDVDYCLRLREHGLYCRLEPRVQLIHHESVSLKDHSRGRGDDFAREVAWMQSRWADAIARDPFHNLNLSLSKFRPLTPYPGNRRAALWPLLGIETGHAPSPADLHPPLRWYVDDNQQRVAEVRQAQRAIELDAPGTQAGLAVLILTKDRPEYIVPLTRALIAAEPAFAARGLTLRIIIGDTGSQDPAVLELYRSLPACCQLVSGLAYQFSRCNNQLLAQARDLDTVLFLNNDVAFDDAADALLQLRSAVHAEPGIGIVGALLQFPDGTVQHQGIAAFEQGPLRGFVHHPGAHAPTTLKPGEQHTCLAVTGALLMARSDALQVTGGFDESYAAECQDVDLCLAAARGGFASAVKHVGRIIHFENGTREIGEENWADRRRLMRRWHNWIEAHWL